MCEFFQSYANINMKNIIVYLFAAIEMKSRGESIETLFCGQEEITFIENLSHKEFCF